MKSLTTALLSVLLLPSLAQADFLDGRLVDANGNGIPFADLDFKNNGSGGNPTVLNDGTDALGYFHVTIPAGNYEVTFNPPQPPASTCLQHVIPSVVVSGTTNIGTVVPPSGVGLYGTVLGPTGLPVAGINIDVIDASGNNLNLLFGSTDAAGAFAIAVPAGQHELRLDTSGLVGTPAPKALSVAAPADTQLGSISLSQGYLVTAIVRRPGNLALANANLDVRDVLTGDKLYTPGDSSNATGFLDVVVPAGNYYFDFFPPAGQLLAALRVGPTSIAATSNLGIVTLAQGVALSGTVSGTGAGALSGIDIDVRDQATQVELPLYNDQTSLTGQYTVYLPAGLFTVEFQPQGAPWSRSVVGNVSVAAATTLNATLPLAVVSFCSGDGSLVTPCPCGNVGQLGRGCDNSIQSGGSLLTASGWILPDTLQLTASGELPTALSIFLQGTSASANGAVFGDGVRCAAGSLKRLMTRNASGGVVSFPNPGDPGIKDRSAALGDVILAGQERIYQVYYRDPNLAFCAAPQGSSFNVSNALRVSW